MLLSILLAFLASVVPFSPIGYRNIDFLSDSEGEISREQVWSIACGTLTYLGTSHGLFVWDGARIERQSPPELSHAIRDLCMERASGRLWSAGFAEFGYWERGTRGIMEYRSLADSAAISTAEDFWRVRINSEGDVCFQSHSRIVVFDTERGSMHTIRPQREFRLMHMVDGILYIQDGDALCTIGKDGLSEPVCRISDRIMGMVSCGGKTIAALERTGLMELKNGRLLSLDPESNQILSGAKIFSLAAYDSGRILVGTTQGGLFILESDGRIIGAPRIEQFSNSTVLSVAADANGDIWAGMEAGLALIDNSSHDYYLMDPRLGRVRAVAPLGRIQFIAASNKGVFLCNPHGVHPIQGSVGSAWNIFQMNGRLLIAHDQGLFGIDSSNKLIPLWTRTGVMGIARSSMDPSIYYIGTYHGITVLRNEGSRFVEETHVSGYEGRCRDIHADSADRLWIRDREHGFIRLTLNAGRDSILDRRDFELVKHSGDAVFTAQMGSTLLLCCNDEAYCVSDTDGGLTPCPAGSELLRKCGKGVNTLVQRTDSTWWYGGSSGCGEIHRLPDGTLSRQPGIFARLRPDREGISFCSIEGGFAAGSFNTIALSYGPRTISEDLRITKVELLGEKGSVIVPPDGPADRIPFKMNTVRISVGGNVNGHLFEYRVPGLLDEWVEVNLIEPVLLSSLRTGTHTAEFRLLSNPEVSCSLKLHVLPPWYFQWWMYFVYLAIILAIIKGSRLEYRKKIRNERVKLELKEKGKELANITFNSAKRNSQLKEIKERLMSGDDAVKLIDGFLSDESDWKNSEEYFNIIYDGLLDKLKAAYPDISKTDLKMCVYAKLNLSTKEIADIMNVSPRSVEMARYRLRKRLGLSSGEDIADLVKDL